MQRLILNHDRWSCSELLASRFPCWPGKVNTFAVHLVVTTTREHRGAQETKQSLVGLCFVVGDTGFELRALPCEVSKTQYQLRGYSQTNGPCRSWDPWD